MTTLATPGTAPGNEPEAAAKSPGQLPAVVSGVPHVEQYAGPLAIEERALQSIVDALNAEGLANHLRASDSGDKEDARKRRVDQARNYVLGAEPVETNAGYLRTQDGVAIVPIVGALSKYGSSLSDAPSTIELRKSVRSAVGDPSVKAIMLQIDSPGGTVAGTVDLADEITAATAKKPVWAYIEDTGASGGYWLAAAADKVYSNRTAIIGSIGVFATYVDSSAQAERYGYKVHVVRAGELKGAGTPGTPITEGQLAAFQRRVDSANKAFVDHVATRRKMTAEQVKAINTGDVWQGAAAQAIGLIDGVRTFDAALAELSAAVATRKAPGHSGGGSGAVAAQPAQPLIAEPVAGEGYPESQPDHTSAAQDAAPTKEPVMPDANASQTAELKISTIAPAPATLKELKAAMPKAPAEFLLSQLEANATVDQAKDAWIAKLEADSTAKDEELAAAKKPAGVKPLTGSGKAKTAAEDGASGGQTGDAVEDFNAAVTAAMKQHNLARLDACVKVGREQPDLHKAYLLATNPSKKAQRQLLEKE